MSSFLKRSPIFCEVQYSFAVQQFHKSGLDVLFYGQEHVDTLAILSRSEDFTQEDVSALAKNQKLLSNKELMNRNLGELVRNLKHCEVFVQKIIVRSLLVTKDRTERRVGTQK